MENENMRENEEMKLEITKASEVQVKSVEWLW